MSELRVLFFLAGTRVKASSRLRGFWVAEELERRGGRCPIVCGRKKRAFLKFLMTLPSVDVVYFQKRYSVWDYALLKLASLLGKHTLFDLDDAPFGVFRSDDTEKAVVRMMKNVSAVVVGSPNLLEYAQQHQSRSFLIPSSIQLAYYPPAVKQASSSPVCLGWIGHGKVYQRDLIAILQEPFQEVAAKYNVRFKLIGAHQQGELYQVFSHIPGLETVLIDHIVDQAEIHREMLDFDIGLYPLLHNEYNVYKCGFKALEYMALELPVITSPVGVNSTIVSDGIDGYHANTKEEWTRALSVLIEDQQLRSTMGKAGRQKAETSYSIGVAAEKLTKVLNTLKRR